MTNSQVRETSSLREFAVSFPAMRGVQAGEEFFVIMCPLRYLPRLFLFDEESVPPEVRAQRALNKGRLPGLVRYILDNRTDFVFSALTASVDGEMEFEPQSVDGHGFRLSQAGIDLEDDWYETLKLITNLSYTRIPIYSGNIDNLIGVALMRKILPLLLNDEFTPESLVDLTREGYFIPESTPLTTQLLNFRKNKRRIGFVVDEYGDIQGLVTIEDILEEIVGEFTSDPSALHQDFFQDADGSFLIDGSTHIREINRNLNVYLPTKGPRTLNGLIIEHMEFIPEAGTSVKIDGYPIEIMQMKNNMVKTARLSIPSDHDVTSPQSELPLNG